MKYLVSDTITEFRTYEVEADSYEDAAELVDIHATDAPEDLTGGLVLVDRGITDRFQQNVTYVGKEIEIGSSHGQVFVFTDGTISRFTDDAEKQFGPDGSGITKFDLDEEAIENGFADILNVGYWHKNGYEPAFTDEDWGN